jgi:hypothetical protein
MSTTSLYPHTHADRPFRKREGTVQRELAKFDYMLPRRRDAPLDENTLKAIASTMNEGMRLSEPPGRGPAGGAIPAGYTYLGQMIDHDLTSDRRLFDNTTEQRTRPVENFSTPQFDLDCLYGGGPNRDPELYDRDAMHFGLAGHDLKRRSSGKAYIKDSRNDSNRILSQIHRAFASFHNRVVDEIGGGSPAADRFERAREEVTRHYQWIVLHDFLPKVVGDPLLKSIMGADGSSAAGNLKLFTPQDKPRMPFEFSAAAFRFGHSMVRAAYALNRSAGQILTFDAAHPEGAGADDLRGFRPLPSDLVIDWEFFFAMPGSSLANLQPARQINTLIAGPLFKLPIDVAQSRSDAGRMLPYRNLHRGETNLGLPTGQEVLTCMREKDVPGANAEQMLGTELPFVIDAGQLDSTGRGNLGGTGIGEAELLVTLNRTTPLWYYVLKEAALAGGDKLGFVGSRIVAEVVIGLIVSDPKGVLNAASRWRPQAGKFGCRKDGEYLFTDLLAMQAANEG